MLSIWFWKEKFHVYPNFCWINLIISRTVMCQLQQLSKLKASPCIATTKQTITTPPPSPPSPISPTPPPPPQLPPPQPPRTTTTPTRPTPATPPIHYQYQSNIKKQYSLRKYLNSVHCYQWWRLWELVLLVNLISQIKSETVFQQNYLKSDLK